MTGWGTVGLSEPQFPHLASGDKSKAVVLESRGQPGLGFSAGLTVARRSLTSSRNCKASLPSTEHLLSSAVESSAPERWSNAEKELGDPIYPHLLSVSYR